MGIGASECTEALRRGGLQTNLLRIAVGFRVFFIEPVARNEIEYRGQRLTSPMGFPSKRALSSAETRQL